MFLVTKDGGDATGGFSQPAMTGSPKTRRRLELEVLHVCMYVCMYVCMWVCK